MCNFPRHCILLEAGGTPSNEPRFGDNDIRNCRVRGHLWRPELRHLQAEYEAFRRGSFTLRCATVFIRQRDFSFVGWRIIFTPVNKWLNRKVLKRQEKTKFPIDPGPPRDKPNSCDQTEGCVGKAECPEQKLQDEYTGRNRRNVRDFGKVFLRSNYTDITQNTYIQS